MSASPIFWCHSLVATSHCIRPLKTRLWDATRNSFFIGANTINRVTSHDRSVTLEWCRGISARSLLAIDSRWSIKDRGASWVWTHSLCALTVSPLDLVSTIKHWQQDQASQEHRSRASIMTRPSLLTVCFETITAHFEVRSSFSCKTSWELCTSSSYRHAVKVMSHYQMLIYPPPNHPPTQAVCDFQRSNLPALLTVSDSCSQRSRTCSKGYKRGNDGEMTHNDAVGYPVRTS